MTGWNTARRRYRLVHDAAADIVRNRQRGLTRWQPAIEAEYGNVDNFLRDIQARYFTTVLARLDAVIEANPDDPQAPTAAVFAEAARVHPDLWQVLHDYAGHPALAEGSARFRRSALAGTGIDPAALMPGSSARDLAGPADSGKPPSPPLSDPSGPGLTDDPDSQTLPSAASCPDLTIARLAQTARLSAWNNTRTQVRTPAPNGDSTRVLSNLLPRSA